MVLKYYSQKDPEVCSIYKALKKGKDVPEDLQSKGLKECYRELSIYEEGIVLRGHQLLIPAKLRGDVLLAAHHCHRGRDSMMKQLCQSVWWPNISGDVKEFVKSCKPCVALEGSVKPPPHCLSYKRKATNSPWLS